MLEREQERRAKNHVRREEQFVLPRDVHPQVQRRVFVPAALALGVVLVAVDVLPVFTTESRVRARPLEVGSVRYVLLLALEVSEGSPC